MLVDGLIKQLEQHKGKEISISTGWVDYKIDTIEDYKGKCDIFLKEDENWED